MSDYSELKKLAEAANAVKSDVNITMAAGTTQEEVKAVQDFLQLAMPKTILALITENERLVRRDQMLAEVGCEYCGGSGYVHRIDGECLGVCDQCLAYDLACATHERDQFKTENAGLKTGYEAYEQVVQGLKAEVEALLATADLQKLLPELDDALEELELHGQHSDQGYRKLNDWYRKTALACAAIDAAMSKGEQS